MIRSLLILLCISAVSRLSIAQERQQWGGGTGFGAAFGVNEDKSAPVVSVLRVAAIAFNGLTPGVSPEFGINFFRLHSKDTGGANDYGTKMITPDLRIRIGWFHSANWSPYFDIGIGVAVYHVEIVPPNASPLARLDDATLFLPIGIGLFHQITDHLGFDLNIGVYPSISDDINPVQDGRIDGWWAVVASAHAIF